MAATTVITLPPTPKPAKTLTEFQQAVAVWTRQAEASIRKVGKVADSGSGGTTQIADATHTGLLSSADWISFNGKQPAGAYITDAPADGTIYGRQNNAWVAAGGTITAGDLTELTSDVLTIGGGTGAVLGSGTTITVIQATSTADGFLSKTDWSLFNGKQSALTLGNLTEATSSILVITGGTNAIIGSGLTLQVKQAGTSQAGFLSAADWNTFNGKQPALGFTPENVANKDNTLTLGVSATLYPTQLAVKTYVDNQISGGVGSKLDATKGGKSVVLCAAFTPALVGADGGEVVMPFDTAGSSLTYSIKRIVFRVGVAGGAPAVTIEKSSGSSGFSATTVGTVTLGAGANEGFVTASLGTINSGDKIRFNVGVLGTAQNWTVIVEIAPP